MHFRGLGNEIMSRTVYEIRLECAILTDMIAPSGEHCESNREREQRVN